MSASEQITTLTSMPPVPIFEFHAVPPTPFHSRQDHLGRFLFRLKVFVTSVIFVRIL